MKLSDARIGYAGYSRDFSAPGDRRRFAAYARLKGLSFEYAELDRDYDVVLVTHNGDISGWTRQKLQARDGPRLIFELADSYFTQTGPTRRLLKGVGRYALGMDSRLSPDFLRSLIRICEAADAVICSTQEQRATILQYNTNVFESFDFFWDDLGPAKHEYQRSSRLRLVWEGQSTTLLNLHAIREPLNDLRDKLELHLVTDPLIHRYFARFGSYPSMEALRGIECDKHFHRWDRATFSDHITACDLAVIPIDTTNEFARGKPENKLVMMWQLGMPVLASATPAYQRAMDRAGIDMSCATVEEWTRRLVSAIAADAAELEQMGCRGREFAERVYSRDEFVRRLDSAFSAAGFDP